MALRSGVSPRAAKRSFDSTSLWKQKGSYDASEGVQDMLYRVGNKTGLP